MAGWIKYWKDTNNDPRLLEAAQAISTRYVVGLKISSAGACDLSAGDALRFASNALRGALVTLWCYADEHIRNDDTLPICSDTLDAMVGIDGFSALIPEDWLVVLDDGTIKLPGYGSKNELIAKEKRRADNKARKAKFDQKRRKSNGVHDARVTQDVTPPVTRYESVTQCVDLDLDLDSKRGTLRSLSAGNLLPSRSLGENGVGTGNNPVGKTEIASTIAATAARLRVTP